MKKKIVFSCLLLLAVAVAVFAVVSIRGDIDGDGGVDTRDVVRVVENVRDGVFSDAADLSGDGLVTVDDARIVQDIYLQTSPFASALKVIEKGADRSLSLDFMMSEDVAFDGGGDIVIEFGMSNSGVGFTPLYNAGGDAVVYSAKASISLLDTVKPGVLLNAAVSVAKSKITNVPLAKLCADGDITFIAKVKTLSSTGEVVKTETYTSTPSERTVNAPLTAQISMESVDMLGRLNYSLLPTNVNDEIIPTRENRDVGIFYSIWLGNQGDTVYDIRDIFKKQMEGLNLIDPFTGKPRNNTDAATYVTKIKSLTGGTSGFFNNIWGREKSWINYGTESEPNYRQDYLPSTNTDDHQFAPMHYWARPLWGYYYQSEKWVIAKQLEMFINAGIDFIYFDFTDYIVPYANTFKNVLDVYKDYHEQGWDVPKLLINCTFGNGISNGNFASDSPFYVDATDYTSRNMIDLMYDCIINNPNLKDEYWDLWYRLPNDAKPCVMARLTNPTPSAAVLANLTVKVGSSPNAGNNQHQYFNRTAKVMTPTTNGIPWIDYHRPQWVYSHSGNPAGVPATSAVAVAPSQNGRTTGASFTAFYGIRGKVTSVSSGGGRYNNEMNMGRSYYSNMNMNEAYNNISGYWNAFNTEAVPTSTASDTAVNGFITAGTEPRTAFYGFNFEEQMSVASTLDPTMILITVWNEWMGTKFYTSNVIGGYQGINFVDDVDLENSRDMEPTKGGSEDSYYLQMTRTIREHKLKNAESNENRSMNGASIIFGESNFMQWADKGYVYRSFDNKYTAERNHKALQIPDPSDGRYSFTDIGWQDYGADGNPQTWSGGWDQIVVYSSPWYRPQTPEFLKSEYGVTMKNSSDPEDSDWGAIKPYFVDNSGRNNIIETRVTYDDVNVYFYVKTKETITSAGDASWMNLLISTNFETVEQSAYQREGVGLSAANAQPKFDFIKTADGFGNYQFIINQSRSTIDGTVSVERFTTVGNFNARTSLGNAAYEISGNEMHICIPRTMLGLESGVRFAFKWTDNVTDMSDVYESYYKTGNAAPIGRLNYYFSS